MKTVTFFLATIMLLWCANTVSAVPIWFDADGALGGYDSVRLTELAGTINGRYNTYQFVDGGLDTSNLDNGDSFLHTDPLSLWLTQAEWNDSPFLPYLDFGDLHIEMTGIGGIITNYNSGPDTDPTNPGTGLPNIADDKYTTVYTPGQGQLDMFWKTDLIGTFEIVQGGGDFTAYSNSTATIDLGFDLLATQINPGYFFLDDGGSKGMDVSTWLAQDPTLKFFWALTDFSVNISGISSGTHNSRDAIIFDSGDNGVDVEFVPQVIPEPGTMVLVGIGLLGMGIVSRRKIKK